MAGIWCIRVIAAAAGLAASVWASAAPAQIVAARYEAPTTRYAHGVLGDAVEYGALVVEVSDSASVRFELPTELVFEDVAPRLWDVTGDGRPEVVVVEAHRDLGARLAVWTEKGRTASTPFIGRSFRWLAPVAAADLDGDGAIEVAYVDRPHLAKTLRVWRYAGGRLTEVATMRGVSNHKIGWSYIIGGLRDCGSGPELMMASGDWTNLLAVTLSGQLLSRVLGAYSANAMIEAMACRSGG
ncbi:MAG: VCBS repeat-containing protein [Pseudomonadota bacterium]